MPEAGFNNRNLNLPSGTGKYVKLKAKGDKIKFLIAGTPQYETKHWISDRDSVLCSKYNSEDKDARCLNCEAWHEALEEAGQDKKKIEEANKLKPQVTFYYPILNLNDNIAAIFQTTQSVHWTIVGYAEDGVDVFKCAWAVERTEDPGSYYVVRRLDEVKLTPDQKQEMEKAKAQKLNKGKSSSSVVEDEEAGVTPEEAEEILH